jgi:hypothetical protein
MVAFTQRGGGFLTFTVVECMNKSALQCHPSLQMSSIEHCNENTIYVFPEKELRSLSLMCLLAIYILYSQDRFTYFPVAD